MRQIKIVFLLGIGSLAVCSTTMAQGQTGCDAEVYECEGYQSEYDYDGDLVDDIDDNCPWQANAQQADQDQDGLGDVCDNCPLHGDETVEVEVEGQPVLLVTQKDLDRDAVGDACDNDVDADAVLNTRDNCPAFYNPGQLDIDEDGQGDMCDDDIDGDQLLNQDDPYPYVADHSLCPEVIEDDTDSESGERQETLCLPDQDKDGVLDAPDPNNPGSVVDNCLNWSNPTQDDLDGDGVGDVCDTDRDGDYILDIQDNCPDDPNTLQTDEDRDGLGDACDTRYNFVISSDGTEFNPAEELEVYTFTPRYVEIDDEVRLRLFVNREDVPLQYLWQVREGIDAKINNPQGETDYSTPFEYHYKLEQTPYFKPENGGVHTIRVTVTLTDPNDGQLKSVFKEISFEVAGEPGDDDDDCDCAVVGHSRSRGVIGSITLLVFGLVVSRWFRRRRRD